jgi:hypothetical protein
MMIKETENVCHQGAGTAKTARADHLANNFAKEAFDEVEPGRGGWCKMQMKAGMALQYMNPRAVADGLALFFASHKL